MNKFRQAISDLDVLVLDGGIATELEKLGHSLDDALWSARLLDDAPEDVMAVHRQYLQAGADIITTLSYQATVEGFVRTGCSEDSAEELIRSSVRLAKSAITSHLDLEGGSPSRCETIVAASVGSYGAFLAGGEEYTGDYSVSQAELVAFHKKRWDLLAGTEPDLMLCETIPSYPELEAIIEVTESSRNSMPGDSHALPVIVSFSCTDGGHIADGTPIEKCARRIETSLLDGMGVNCVPPSWTDDLIQRMREELTKSVLVYPNSGEQFDAQSKQWVGHSDPVDFEKSAERWVALGASIIGGCCRTTPATVQSIARACAGLPPAA